MKNKDLYKAVLGDLQTNLSPMVFKTNFLVTKAGEGSEEALEIICPKEYVKEQISKKFMGLLKDTVRKIAGKDMGIVLTVEEAEVKTEVEGLPLFTGSKKSDQSAPAENPLSAKYTFSSFIVGPTNRLAHAIALAITENPGKVYNPFFLHAGVGLGKTHLMQAIGNEIIAKNPSSKVVYATAESFMNELIETIQEGRNKNYTANKFRNKFRKADVLLVDDIQFIAGRGEATQEEFFHTFNALYMAQKQIVLTSDRPPRELSKLDARITSRFASGMVADIQAPGSETRSAILREKRDQMRAEVPNEVVDYIAQKVETNIRELEGVFLQIITQAKAEGAPISKEFAAKVLGEKLLDKPTVGINDILKTICAYYSIKITDLKGKRRIKEFVVPRHVSMYMVKRFSDIPYVAIGDLLGGRDHTTVMHGEKRVEALILSDSKLKQDLVNIKRTLNISVEN